jgi:hypothetical protein
MRTYGKVVQTNKYRVWFRSTSGFYEQYYGAVDDYAGSDDQAIDTAFVKLKCGAFLDRSRSMWKVEKVERLL